MTDVDPTSSDFSPASDQSGPEETEAAGLAPLTAHAQKVDFDPDAMTAKDCYKLMVGLVVPRPIGWIGTRAKDGTNNLAPFSFFNAVAGTPPAVIFSGGRTDGVPRDTVVNASETRDFTVNIVTEEMVGAMIRSASAYPPEVDEFERAGLTAVAGDVVAAPMVAEAKANLECRVVEIVPIGKPGTGWTLFVGHVVRYHVRPNLLDGTRIDPVELKAIGRMAGPNFTHTRDRFHLEIPEV